MLLNLNMDYALQGFSSQCALLPPKEFEVFSRKAFLSDGIVQSNLKQAPLVINVLELLMSKEYQVRPPLRGNKEEWQ